MTCKEGKTRAIKLKHIISFIAKEKVSLKKEESRAIGLACSAEVTVIRVLISWYYMDTPGTVIFIQRLEAALMNSVLSADLFFNRFICQAAKFCSGEGDSRVQSNFFFWGGGGRGG